jgi:hypothetical protein
MFFLVLLCLQIDALLEPTTEILYLAEKSYANQIYYMELKLMDTMYLLFFNLESPGK